MTSDEDIETMIAEMGEAIDAGEFGIDPALGIVTSPTVWPVINHTRKHSHHIEIRRSYFLDGASGRMVAEYRWLLRAGNGHYISRSPERYYRKRDLVHGLELASGMLMLDQNQELIGGSWYLYGVRLCYDDFLEAGKQATKLVEGVVIPVRVPDGSGLHWGSRRQR